MLLRQRAQDANHYTSYEVNISFQGQTRRYRALAVYRFAGPIEASGQPQVQKAEPPTRILIWDNITSEMNTVANDESPRIQSPWDKYVKTSWYVGVVNEIGATRQAGKPLIPADAPIGYLPGDNISATRDDQRVIANADPCAPACAIPTNFRQSAASDAGSGTLHGTAEHRALCRVKTRMEVGNSP